MGHTPCPGTGPCWSHPIRRSAGQRSIDAPRRPYPVLRQNYHFQRAVPHHQHAGSRSGHGSAILRRYPSPKT
ncbi:MAG: hypothetical protein MZV64_17800 [Ignavibacteriales bacterium]|nr:hypothetical protein [Ignavibacteriales bacterium]